MNVRIDVVRPVSEIHLAAIRHAIHFIFVGGAFNGWFLQGNERIGGFREGLPGSVCRGWWACGRGCRLSGGIFTKVSCKCQQRQER